MYPYVGLFLKQKPPNSRLKSRECGGYIFNQRQSLWDWLPVCASEAVLRRMEELASAKRLCGIAVLFF